MIERQWKVLLMGEPMLNCLYCLQILWNSCDKSSIAVINKHDLFSGNYSLCGRDILIGINFTLKSRVKERNVWLYKSSRYLSTSSYLIDKMNHGKYSGGFIYRLNNNFSLKFQKSNSRLMSKVWVWCELALGRNQNKKTERIEASRRELQCSITDDISVHRQLVKRDPLII